jgi:hypothetical protein
LKRGVAVAYSRKRRTGKPVIKQTSGGVRIQHCELYNSNVAGSLAYTIQNTIALNPGLASTFPWLAPQAEKWEQYVCHRLSVEWEPIAPTNTQGVIAISPEYDPNDEPPTTEQELAATEGTVYDKVWEDFECVLDRKAMMGGVARKFVRSAAVAGNKKMYDLGKCYVVSNNETSTNSVGKVWICYDFEFFIPQDSPAPTVSSVTSMFSRELLQTLATTVTTPVDYDPDPPNNPLNLAYAAGGYITPPAGVYKCQATFGPKDTVSEAFSMVGRFYKNGTGIGSIAQTQNTDHRLYDSYNLFAEAIISCNGTDVITFEVTLSGPAGVLTLQPNTCFAFISVA